VEGNVVTTVEKLVESHGPSGHDAAPAAEIRLLGPLSVRRRGVDVVLPRSRKVKALLSYLALAPLAVSREQLCEMLWDVPNDPRGELRWCLSKIRTVLDEPECPRVLSSDGALRLDLADCFVDAIDVAGKVKEGTESLSVDQQRRLAGLFQGDFLDGLEIDRSPLFEGWLTAQRRRFRGIRTALLEHLVGCTPEHEAGRYLEQWLALAPFDRRVHEHLLTRLAQSGRMREGEEHLAATVRLFEAEGLDPAPLRTAWQRARTERSSAPALELSAAAAAESPRPEEELAAGRRRASIAVMPFVDESRGPRERGGPADALAHDVITRLAKLRSLFVIAQGTVFALHERRIGPEEAGRTLNVDYVASGTARGDGKRLVVSVELIETRTARIVWAETFNDRRDDALSILDELGNRIVASIASEIELIERNRAVLRPPSSLDAWEAHHRGLWHMYRFNRPDNERAQDFFRTAVKLDPTFARAHAGLSFTHFQNAFQGWARREQEIDWAFETAGQSLLADDRDPAAHSAMGRALWLRREPQQSIIELTQAVELSPNFAMAHYTLAFVHAQSGDANTAITLSDYSRSLSPFDPLLFGMLGARAIALVRLNNFDEAAQWASKAAARPNAHTHILAIAAYTSALAGAAREAQSYAAAIHRNVPRYGVADFLRAFHFDDEGVKLFRKGAKLLEVR
jgi:DNA-binding SARP family transcriptional activator